MGAELAKSKNLEKWMIEAYLQNITKERGETRINFCFKN